MTSNKAKFPFHTSPPYPRRFPGLEDSCKTLGDITHRWVGETIKKLNKRQLTTQQDLLYHWG